MDIKTLVLFFMTIVISLVFLVVIFNQTATQSELATITGDQYTASNTSCVAVTTNCMTSLTSVVNVSGETIGEANYSICRANRASPFYDGIINNGDATTNEWYNGQTLNASYIESTGCNYNPSTTSRGLYVIIILLVTLGIVIAGISYFKEGGIMEMFGK